MTLLKIYFLEITAAAFLLCAVDKQRARKGAWRVPEAALILSAILGGTMGLLFGMLLLRHKTKNKRFLIGIPLILLFQLVALHFLGNI